MRLCHAKYVPKGGVVIDIGANVGNHTVFFVEVDDQNDDAFHA